MHSPEFLSIKENYRRKRFTFKALMSFYDPSCFERSLPCELLTEVNFETYLARYISTMIIIILIHVYLIEIFAKYPPFKQRMKHDLSICNIVDRFS